jgi:(S)-2-hydroxyglutarate dehydrogenase
VTGAGGSREVRDLDVRDLDVAIVGGGIVGLATAHRLLLARPGLRVLVLEADDEIAGHQSSRNSGVLHAGLYYRPGSAKARWCVEGKRSMERFCAEHGVPAERRGKVVVAVDRGELPGLADLAARARTNGVEVHELDAAGIRGHEPHAAGIAGLWSPSTGVTDFGAVAHELVALIEAAGGEVRTGARVIGIDDRRGSVRVSVDSQTADGDGPVLQARTAVVCGGVQADRLARLGGLDVDERILPVRGAWLELAPARRHLVRGNIYPVPVAGGLPFLGVHLTRRIDGSVLIGPNAVATAARSDARRWGLDRRDLTETLRHPGTWRLARAHLGTAVSELVQDVIPAVALRAVRRYVPAITADDVQPGPFGVRAQLLDRQGRLVDDFLVRSTDRVLHVLNAPSPAATASLEIGASLRDRVLDRLDR